MVCFVRSANERPIYLTAGLVPAVGGARAAWRLGMLSCSVVSGDPSPSGSAPCGGQEAQEALPAASICLIGQNQRTWLPDL